MPADNPVPEVTDSSDLYSLPLDQFTAARDQLADRLRAGDDPEEAKRVAKLRKPSIAAWALNRVSRTSPKLVEGLLETHRELRQAGSVEKMRDASEARRTAVSALVEGAAEVLRADGRPDSDQTRDRVARTLLAVATDPEGEADLKEGTLVRELEPSGGGWGDFALAPPPAPDPAREAEEAADQARSRLKKLEKEAAEAERHLEVAEQAVKTARRRAKEARSAVEDAAEAVRTAEAKSKKRG